MTETCATFPWRNGFWPISGKEPISPWFVDNKFEYKSLVCLDYPEMEATAGGTLVAGDFGETDKEIKEKTGAERYNIQLKSPWFERAGVLNTEGTTVHIMGMVPGEVDVMEWADEKKMKQLRDDREPMDAPILPPYVTVRPGEPGKVVWIMGPPGSGKSTTAQLLARHHNHVYYEVDALFAFVNPFIDNQEANPAYATVSQKPLKGVPLEAIKTMLDSKKAFQEFLSGKFDGLDEALRRCAPFVAEHIVQQKQRVGGNLSVAWAVYSRGQRDVLRSIIGSDLILIILSLDEQCQQKRISVRQAGATDGVIDALVKMNSLYEGAGNDEPNTYDVLVTEQMTPDDVTNKVMEILENVK